MAERRAETSRGRLHRGHARRHGDFELEPSRVFLDRLEHSRRHGEHARIAARDDGDRASFRGKFERELGALHFDAIVARMDALVRAQDEPPDIGP